MQKKPIQNWENDYTIDTSGTITNIHTGHIKKPDINSTGYLRVTLYNKEHNPPKQRFFIHRLVAAHFIPNPDNKSEINHIDGNKQNNNVSNLEWVSRTENEHAARKTGIKTYKPFKVTYDNGNIKIFEFKQDLANELHITKALVQCWLHNTSKTYNKYGIQSIEYL